jgi:Protein of unknown function (DUF433)
MERQGWMDRIIVDSRLHGGEPCIKGTRIPVQVMVRPLCTVKGGVDSLTRNCGRACKPKNDGWLLLTKLSAISARMSLAHTQVSSCFGLTRRAADNTWNSPALPCALSA